MGESVVSTWIEDEVSVYGSEVGNRASWIRRGSRLDHSRVGDRVFMGFRCQVSWAEVRDSSQMGAKVHLRGTQDFPVRVGSCCWLGAGVDVAPGVTIGEGAVIGAGSQVVENVPPYWVSAGRPARLLRKRAPVWDGVPDFSAFLLTVRLRAAEQVHREVPVLQGARHVGPRCFVTASLSLGEGVRLGADVVLIGQKDAEGHGGIWMADDVEIGDEAILEGAGGISLDDRVTIEDKALLLTTAHDYRFLSLPQLRTPLVIEEDAVIGSNSIIVGGVKVSVGARVAPNSVVTNDVPPGAVVTGVPAKVSG